MAGISLHELIKETVLTNITNQKLQIILSAIIVTVFFFAITFLLDKIIRKAGIFKLNNRLRNSRSVFLAALANNRVFNVISLLIFSLVFEIGSAFISFKGDDPYTQKYALLLQQFAHFILFLAITIFIIRLINAANSYYEHKFNQEQHPIYGYIKMSQFAVWCISTILYISIVLDKSPMATLTGIGAISAFFMLIFKDTILGLMSSIQATANQVVKLGDWINIPKFNVDGEVIHISINVIKIRNWDNTVTTIPTFALTSDSIHNWQEMVKSGARRIMRSINIDVQSVKQCNSQLLQRLSEKYVFVKNYLSRSNNPELSNLALFRLFMNHFLSESDLLHDNYPRLLRYLQPGNQGIPLQVYAYSRNIYLQEFEETQSLIFEYILDSLPDFELRVFQSQVIIEQK